MFDTIYAQLVLVAAVVVVSFAFIKGDETERMAAAAYALIFVAGSMIRDGTSLSFPRWGFMGLETVLLVVLVGLAIHSRRTWLIWATSFEAMIVTGHILVAAELRPPPNAVAAVINMCNYGLLVSMAVGTFWAWQERRAAGLE